MSAKPENTFRNSVHKFLPSDLHHEKMANPYRGGTWDDWYSGTKADLWIEYKFIVIPKWGTTTITPNLSEQQLDWGRDRYSEGRNLAVVVGSKEGGVLFVDRLWERSVSTEQFRNCLLSRKELASWILAFTRGGP